MAHRRLRQIQFLAKGGDVSLPLGQFEQNAQPRSIRQQPEKRAKLVEILIGNRLFLLQHTDGLLVVTTSTSQSPPHRGQNYKKNRPYGQIDLREFLPANYVIFGANSLRPFWCVRQADAGTCRTGTAPLHFLQRMPA
jgi:hypothetical protein